MNAVFAAHQAVQDMVGMSRGELNFLVCLVCSWPLALVHRSIRQARARHAFSLVLGLVFAFSIYEWEALHLVASALVTWLLVRFLPVGTAHIVVFVVTMTHLVIGHAYVTWAHYLQFDLEWTSSCMMLVVRSTWFAWNHYDGCRPAAEQRQLHASLRARAVSSMPSLLEFGGYCFYFPTLMCGPPIGFRQYMRFTDHSLFDAEPKRQAPSPWSWNACGHRFALVALAVVFKFGGDAVPVQRCHTASFLALPFAWRLGYITVSTMFAFYPYLIGWFSAEAANCLSGIAYNGRDKEGQPRWDAANMVNFSRWALAQSGRQVSENWNVQCALWLRHCLYFRLVSPASSFGRKAGAIFAVFGVSAVWHGCYPGFYTSFVSLAFFNVVCQMARDVFRGYVVQLVERCDKDGSVVIQEVPLKGKWVYDLVGWVVVFNCFYYSAIPFKMMSLQRVHACWSAVGYFYHLLFVAFGLFLNVFGSLLRKKPRRVKAKQQ